MPRKLHIKAESFPLAGPFAISRGVKTAADVVVVEISESGVTGHAECVPYLRYDEMVGSVIAQIEDMRLPIYEDADADEVNQTVSGCGQKRHRLRALGLTCEAQMERASPSLQVWVRCILRSRPKRLASAPQRKWAAVPLIYHLHRF